MANTLKNRLNNIIFEADTLPGKTFDVVLLIVIVLSIFIVILESVASLNQAYGDLFRFTEWIITITFTIEYILRIIVAKKPISYIFSFFGIIDLLAILPTYVGLFFIGAQSLLVIRALRLLRIFRILKISRYSSEGRLIIIALKAARAKISVFMFAVLTIILIIGTIMYLVEGSENGFTSIPKGIYWAVVTLTTVGYGDIAPQTTIGQFIAAFVMILGYAIIAVPTGIVTAEISVAKKDQKYSLKCPECLKEGLAKDSIYCRHCGKRIG